VKDGDFLRSPLQIKKGRGLLPERRVLSHFWEGKDFGSFISDGSRGGGWEGRGSMPLKEEEEFLVTEEVVWLNIRRWWEKRGGVKKGFAGKKLRRGTCNNWGKGKGRKTTI